MRQTKMINLEEKLKIYTKIAICCATMIFNICNNKATAEVCALGEVVA